MTDELIGRRSIESSVGRVTVSRGRTRENGISLAINGVCQSYVDLNDPTYMHLHYVQSLSKIIDRIIGEHDWVERVNPSILHIGGGALTIPRRLHELYPLSDQTIFEPNTEMLELLFEVAPIHVDFHAHIYHVFGETGILSVGDASLDLIVLDAFVGQRIPEALQTAEFFREAHRVLKPGSSLVINVIEVRPGHEVTAPLMEAVANSFSEVHVEGSRGMVNGTSSVGNLTIVATY